MVETLSHEVQSRRPFPGLLTGDGLGRREDGIVEAEARRELDDDRLPAAPGCPEIVRKRPADGIDPDALARRPFSWCSLSGSDHDGSAENHQVGHWLILPHQVFPFLIRSWHGERRRVERCVRG